MEALKRTIDSFKEMLDIFQCPYPNFDETYKIKDLTDVEWCYLLESKSHYIFDWYKNNSVRKINYPLRRGVREMYVTNTHILLVETRIVRYHTLRYYTVLDRSKEMRKEGADA